MSKGVRTSVVKRSNRLSKQAGSLGFPKALMAIGSVLLFAVLMFYLGYVVGYDTVTISCPPYPSGRTIRELPARGLIDL